jgi:hypothetical protein
LSPAGSKSGSLAPLQALPERPRLRADLRIAQSGPDAFLVVDPATGKAFRFGSEERYLLHLLDGERAAEEVQEAYERHAERPIARRHVEEFLEQLRLLDLLEDPARAPAAQRAAQNGRSAAPETARSRERVRRLNRRFDVLVLLFGWLIHPVWIAPILLLTAVVGTGLLRSSGRFLGDMWMFLGELSLPLLLLKLLVIFLSITFLRSLAFGIAARKAGVRLERFGVGFLHSLVPYFHCELGQLGPGLSKAGLARMIYVRFWSKLAFTSLAVLGWLMAPPATTRSTLFLLVSYHFLIGVIFQLIPFLQTDLYAAISRWTRTPDLYGRALAETRAWLRWGRSPQALTERERFWFRVFGLGALLTNFLLHALLMLGGAYMLHGKYGGPGALLALFLSAWWFLRPFERLRSVARA